MIDYEIPMPRYTIEGRKSMRSIADAIERLRSERRLSDDSRLQVRTIPIRLPGGDVTSVVVVIGEPLSGEPNCGVTLPSSNFFTARTLDGGSLRFEISRLDHAWADSDGRVQLSDGTSLFAVTMIPTPIRYELTERQKRIVYWTIKFMDAEVEARCYRGFPATPDLEWLDYGQLHELKPPKLKAIAQYLIENDPTLRVSRQTIANALGASGMRRPRSGRMAA